MSYNMRKTHMDHWKQIFLISKKNRLRLLNPFYTKRQFVMDLYKNRMGNRLNLDNPTTFNDKLNILKIDPVVSREYWRFVDKHEVRKYVEDKIGKQYLIPELLHVKKIKIEDWNKLPEKFVLKTTNGSGTNYIVDDKAAEDKKAIINYINRLTKLKYGYVWGEFYYNRIKPTVIAEILLLDKANNIPDDLKCYCFRDKDGVRRKVLYIERVIGDERFRIMFDEDWRQVDYVSGFKPLNIKIKKPHNYKEILWVIDKLSEDFNFVRVDLFVLNNKIYFGELTFVPTAGFMELKDVDTEVLWGSWIG